MYMTACGEMPYKPNISTQLKMLDLLQIWTINKLSNNHDQLEALSVLGPWYSLQVSDEKSYERVERIQQLR